MLGLPWYTILAMLFVVLFIIGAWFAVFRLLLQGMLAAFRGAWTLLCLGITQLFGWQLSSGGTAHFATTREMRKAGVFNTVGLPLGTWRDGQTIREPRGSHIALVAPPRSGKSWGAVMPVLREYPGSCIVTDLRSELYEHTGKDREKFGPVYCFNPVSPDSCKLNILDAIRWHTSERYGDVDRVCHHVLAPISTGSGIGDEFRQDGIPLLRSVMFDRYSAGEGNFPAISDWLNDPMRPIKEKLEELLASPDPQVQRGARRTLDMSPKLKQGVWHAVIEALGIFEDPVVHENTKKSEVLLTDLLDGPEPVTIYLTMPFHEIARLGRYLGLFVECMVSLVSGSQGIARHKLLLCLDEFMNLGKLSGLEKTVSHLQGSGCQALFVLQNTSQFVDTYGETSPLLSSVSTHIFYTPVPTDTRTSDLISKSLGQTTVHTLSLSTAPGVLGVTTQTQSEHTRALRTPDEVTTMPKTAAIILTQEHPPMYATKLGQIPPSRHKRVWAQVAQYPGAAGALAAMAVLMFALSPLLTYDPRANPIVAALVSLADIPRTVVATLPKNDPLVKWWATVEQRQKQEVETLPGAWVLMHDAKKTPVHGGTLEGPGPEKKDTYRDKAACLAALKVYEEQGLKELEGMAKRDNGPVIDIQRQPDRKSWKATATVVQSVVVNGKTVQETVVRGFEHSAWCQERES